MGMGRVRLPLQAIADQHIGALIQLSHRIGHFIEIYCINQRSFTVIDAQTQRRDFAVRLIDEADLCVTERQLRIEGRRFHEGRIESGAGEGIAKTLL